jgi:hypothetical protein
MQSVALTMTWAVPVGNQETAVVLEVRTGQNMLKEAEGPAERVTASRP